MLNDRLTAGATAFAILMGAAQADQPTSATPFQLYDSHGQLVGQVIDAFSVLYQQDGQVYQLEIDSPGGLSATPALFYASNNCSGQPYILEAPQPTLVRLTYFQQYANPGGSANVLWIANPNNSPQVVTLQSEWAQNNPAQGEATCYPFAPNPEKMQAAVPLQNPNFHPPFCIGGRNGRPCSTK